MEKAAKGSYGYFAWEKRRRALETLVRFLPSVLLAVVGYMQTGTRKNLFTLAAILVCLPACRSLVGWIMMLPRKSMEQAAYEKIRARAGGLAMAYDLYFTTYEKNIAVDAMAVGGGQVIQVIGYCSRRQEHRADMEGYIRDTIAAGGYPVAVRLLEELQPFLDALDMLDALDAAEGSESLDARPGGGGDPKGQEELADKTEKVRQILLAVTL